MVEIFRWSVLPAVLWGIQPHLLPTTNNNTREPHILKSLYLPENIMTSRIPTTGAPRLSTAPSSIKPRQLVRVFQSRPTESC